MKNENDTHFHTSNANIQASTNAMGRGKAWKHESGSHFVKCAKKKSEYGNANRRKTRDRVRIYNEPARTVRAASSDNSN